MKLVRWYCPTHGYIVSASERATVFCGERVRVKATTRRCNKRATTTKPDRKKVLA